MTRARRGFAFPLILALMGVLGLTGLSALTLTSNARLQKERTAREQAIALSPGDGVSLYGVGVLTERDERLFVAGQVPFWLLTAVPANDRGFQDVGKSLVREMGWVSERSVGFLAALRGWTVMADEAYALGGAYLYAVSPESSGPAFLVPLTDGRWRNQEYASMYAAMRSASLMRVIHSVREGLEDPSLTVKGLWERTRRGNEKIFTRNI